MFIVACRVVPSESVYEIARTNARPRWLEDT